jgi:hypothetical protein
VHTSQKLDLQNRWKWDLEKIIKPDLSYYSPEIILWNLDNSTGSISLFEPLNQELIAITEQPLIKNSEDSFSIEIVTSLSKNINIGLAAMVYDNQHAKDWVMVKGWYLNLKTLKRKWEIDKEWNAFHEGDLSVQEGDIVKVTLDTWEEKGSLMFSIWSQASGWVSLGIAFKSTSLKEEDVFPYVCLKNSSDEKIQEVRILST